MTIAFYEFLEAKYWLDERSLNSTVQAAFQAKLKDYDELVNSCPCRLFEILEGFKG